MTRQLARQRLVYALVLGLLASLGPLCIDLYLPALPEMAGDLNTSTATAQLSLTAGLLGLGVGQLIFGPYSDKLGRMRPLLLSLTLLLAASLWCALAPQYRSVADCPSVARAGRCRRCRHFSRYRP
ncbi:Sulfonamide resistance protein [Serratia quinivorans]|uniref:Sulfonamide resistance protein n=1 Tax=Serratia quinivorans TaxID=137545 RepID=A0A379YTY6_9GAMM|nr:Sulfonamide resistance protein [Serratia quinivorans]